MSLEKTIKNLITKIKANKVKDKKAAIAKVNKLRSLLYWNQFLSK